MGVAGLDTVDEDDAEALVGTDSEIWAQRSRSTLEIREDLGQGLAVVQGRTSFSKMEITGRVGEQGRRRRQE